MHEVVRVPVDELGDRGTLRAAYLRGPIFEPLRTDRALFAAVSVDPIFGTVVWPNGADIDPEVLIHGRTPAVLHAETRF